MLEILLPFFAIALFLIFGAVMYGIGISVGKRRHVDHQLNEIRRMLMAQEQTLQQVLALVTTNGEGLTTIITMLTELRDNNPALQDEIDGILAEAQTQADKIQAVLNPPTP